MSIQTAGAVDSRFGRYHRWRTFGCQQCYHRCRSTCDGISTSLWCDIWRHIPKVCMWINLFLMWLQLCTYIRVDRRTLNKPLTWPIIQASWQNARLTVNTTLELYQSTPEYLHKLSDSYKTHAIVVDISCHSTQYTKGICSLHKAIVAQDNFPQELVQEIIVNKSCIRRTLNSRIISPIQYISF